MRKEHVMPKTLGWLIVLLSTPLFADGGAVLLQRQSGPFTVTVFASPTPLRAGPIDLSVFVQSSDTIDPMLDADVSIEFTGPGTPIRVRATRGNASNKLLYAASVDLKTPGDWEYSVSIHTPRTPSKPMVVSGAITLLAGQPKLTTYWSYLALPFLCLAMLALHQWLRFGASRPVVDLRR
jgi:hypothetical protein